jgi:hypothetical protein
LVRLIIDKIEQIKFLFEKFFVFLLQTTNLIISRQNEFKRIKVFKRYQVFSIFKMSHHPPHHLKRLQHDVNSNLHLSSHNHHFKQSNNSHTNSSDHCSRLPTDEAVQESIQHFTISASDHTKLSRPVLISFSH